MNTTAHRLFPTTDDNGAPTFAGVDGDHAGPVFAVRVTASGAREAREEVAHFGDALAAEHFARRTLDAADPRLTCSPEEAEAAALCTRRDGSSVAFVAPGSGSALWAVTAVVATATPHADARAAVVAALAGTAIVRGRPARFGDFSGRADGFALACGGHILARYATRPEADGAAETAAAAYAAWLRTEAIAVGLAPESVTRDGLTVTSPAGAETFAVEACEVFAA